MAYVESNFQLPTRHNPYLHEIVINTLKKIGPGRVLDLPSGPGYLLKDLKEFGFSGVAGEIDEQLHVFNDLEYQKINMVAEFDLPTASFDYVVSIEGIEHIENHFAFLRECRRVLKPGGTFMLTTPNVSSLESRWNFFVSGFHQLAERPIPLDTENIYFEHINPIPFHQLYFACEKAGLKIKELKTRRYRRGSRLMYFLFYPFIKWATYSACFVREKNPARREANRDLYKFLSSKENMFGTHTIIVAEAK
jgi:2-polyprenyl-3-methyl-5-hydroxy-6-metoxy-1,4-benzoquinol methylase